MEWLILLIIVVVLVLVIGIYLWATYNSLVTLNVRVDEAWSDITVLKRRADLIPNLIEAVKGYAAHEKAVFENAEGARRDPLGARPRRGGRGREPHAAGAEVDLRGRRGVPAAAGEPELPQLQAELVDTEDKIQASRRFYNGGVRELNKIGFPNTLFVRSLGFHEREFFEVTEAAAIAGRRACSSSDVPSDRPEQAQHRLHDPAVPRHRRRATATSPR